MTGGGPQTQRRLPVGTVTFLLTDIERSTLLWEADADAMAAAVQRHDEIVRAAIAAHGGVRPEEQGEGDSVVAAFTRASDAVRAALAAQQGLQREAWPTPSPVKVRMAIHTGEAVLRDDDNYVGIAIIRTARLRAIAAGAQVLVSSASHDLAVDQLDPAIELVDVGEYRLKDLARPERVFQLVHPDLADDFPPLRSSDAVPNNLPVRLSTFVGRHDELAELGTLVAERRLVTVVGSGGAGKTRLALQVATDTSDRFPDGVWWIELAPVADAESMALAVLETIGARLGATEGSAATIARRLAGDRALLVMDNCEHVIDAAAGLVDELLQVCPNLTVVATSRLPLEVPGEVIWRAPSMAVPVAGARLTPDQLAELDSVRLFTARARDIRPTFEVSESNAAAIAEICHRLDGMPLAIELAAARTKTMLPEQIRDGLSDALRLLTGGPRRVLPRQQTLEASIAWSVDLLGEVERTVLARLSVFSGTFDLRSAEAVCGGDGVPEVAVLDALERLVDSSLVVNGGAGRFRMLETIRQHGQRQLLEADEHDTVRRRHAQQFERLAHEVAPACETDRQEDAIVAVLADYDNIRTALQWLSSRGEGGRLAEMVLALGSFWDVAGVRIDAAFWCARALALIPDEPTPLRSRLLALSAESRIQVGEFTAGYLDAQAGVEMAAEIGDDWASGRANSTITTILGLIDLPAWREQWTHTERVLLASGDTYSLTRLRTWQGVMLARRGMLREANEAFDDAVPHIEASRQPMLIASHRMWQGFAAIPSGDPALGEDLCRSALAGTALRGATRIGIARSTLAMSRAVRFLDREPAQAHLDRLEQARRNSDPVLGDVHFFSAAVELLHEDPARCRDIVDAWHDEHRRRTSMARAAEGILAAHAAFALGDLDDAEVRAQAVVRWSDECSSVIEHARASVLLGAIALRRGDIPAAEQHARSAIVEHWTNGTLLSLCDALELLAAVAAACEDVDEAETILGATALQRSVMGTPRGYLIDLLPEADALLRSDGASRTTGEAGGPSDPGSALALDAVVAYVQRTRGRRGRPSLGWHSLTPTELAVADLVQIGMTNREIAAQLIMGAETVKTHLSHIFTKLGISKRAQLAVLAAEHSTRADEDGRHDG